LFEAISSTWIKNFNQIYNYLYGTFIGQPVQIGVNIGSAVIDLVKTPMDEYNKGGNILRGSFPKFFS
jgi:hypothetical protein